MSRVTILITHIRGFITPLISTHEPPSIPILGPTAMLACSCPKRRPPRPRPSVPQAMPRNDRSFREVPLRVPLRVL